MAEEVAQPYYRDLHRRVHLDHLDAKSNVSPV
jgi:hypothetical protein